MWNSISPKINKSNFQKEDLLFGVWQDRSSTEMILVVKDTKDLMVAIVEFPMGGNDHKISIGSEIFNIENLPTWKKSATLKSKNGILMANFKRLNIFLDDQFEVPGHENITAFRVPFDQRRLAKLAIEGKHVGITQNISPRFKIGRIGIIPHSLPLSVRIFLLVYG